MSTACTTWQAHERIVVGLTGGPEGHTLIRRAARLAEKGAGGEVPPSTSPPATG